jgi:hypothetical protein
MPESLDKIQPQRVMAKSYIAIEWQQNGNQFAIQSPIHSGSIYRSKQVIKLSYFGNRFPKWIHLCKNRAVKHNFYLLILIGLRFVQMLPSTV